MDLLQVITDFMKNNQIPFWHVWFGWGGIYATLAAIASNDTSHSRTGVAIIVPWAVRFFLPILMVIDMLLYLNKK